MPRPIASRTRIVLLAAAVPATLASAQSTPPGGAEDDAFGLIENSASGAELSESKGFWDPEAMGGSNALAGMLMAGGILIITFILMARLRRKQRSAPPGMSTTEQVAAIRARAGDRSSIDSFKADAHDFTRQMAALLDSKAERLELLIADADDRLARLGRTAELERGSGAVSGDPEPARRTVPRRQPSGLPDRDTIDPLHNKVYHLADSGLDPIAIARETGQPTGKIELILALRS